MFQEDFFFTIPLGATINMDGTSIMQGVAVMFAAQAFGIQLTPMDYVTVIGTATLASIGTAGIPSVGLVTLTMVFNSVGLPVEAIGIIMVLTVFWIWREQRLILPVMLFVRPLWLARMGLWIKKCLIKAE